MPTVVTIRGMGPGLNKKGESQLYIHYSFLPDTLLNRNQTKLWGKTSACFLQLLVLVFCHTDKTARTACHLTSPSLIKMNIYSSNEWWSWAHFMCLSCEYLWYALGVSFFLFLLILVFWGLNSGSRAYLEPDLSVSYTLRHYQFVTLLAVVLM